MSVQKALLLKDEQGTLEIGTITVPKPGPGEVLIKVNLTLAVYEVPADASLR
jgi:D-arabinose 1-dehydrogenase-like Zn-dependent alcohol dehydrogenase